MEEKEKEKENENEKIININNYEWTFDEFKMIESTYQRLSINSAHLLEIAKSCKSKESFMQYTIVLLGLTSSFMSALPGIPSEIRTYIVSIFTLLSAMLGGIMSKKSYGQKAGKYYSAYQEYKDILTSIDNMIVTLKSDRNYESFNLHISKIESKYEIFLPIETIDIIKIRHDCLIKFDSISDRFKQVDNMKQIEKFKNFMDRKSYIYLHECKLKMYRQYVYKSKIKDGIDEKDILDCYSYENFCRIHHPNKFKTFSQVYNDYINIQLSRYKNGNDYDGNKIKNELSTNKLFSLEEREFNRILYEKFIEYQNTIKKREYKEEEENESSNENYSLE